MGPVRRSRLEAAAGKWVLALRKPKQPVSVSTIQVQTPAALPGGDPLAGKSGRKAHTEKAA